MLYLGRLLSTHVSALAATNIVLRKLPSKPQSISFSVGIRSICKLIEYIKPSLPTPNHLKTHKISLLDQFVPAMYIPMVFYYPANNETPIQTNKEKLRLLKESLSKTLTSFYPYAGTIKDSLSIDCNDKGVYFAEASVDCSLSEFLKHPNLSPVHHLPSSVSSWKEMVVGDHVAMVQVSTFNCGAMSIEVIFGHSIEDGASRSYFLKNWATTLRKGSCDVTVNFDIIQSVLPQNESFPRELSRMGMLYPFLKKGKSSTSRFVFDATALAKLKAKVMSTSVPNPTRVEVVSALIWKCTMAALKVKNGGIEKPCVLSHVVDLRRRVPPPYSECKTGNLLFMATTKFTPQINAKIELGHLVSAIKKAKGEVNYDFLKNVDGGEGFNEFCKAAKEMSEFLNSSAREGADFLGFTSSINFGLYDHTDFGWGKPAWITCNVWKKHESSVFQNYVLLSDTKSVNGIEAWVTLDEQTMSLLEADQELLEFASLNPSPLNFGTKSI